MKKLLLSLVVIGISFGSFSCVSVSEPTTVVENVDYFVTINARLYSRGKDGSTGLIGTRLSGFLYQDPETRDYFVITASHLQQSSERLVYALANLRNSNNSRGKNSYSLQVVGYDRRSDVMMLKITESNFVFNGKLPQWGDSDELRGGEKVVAVGHARNTYFRNEGKMLGRLVLTKQILGRLVLTDWRGDVSICLLTDKKGEPKKADPEKVSTFLLHSAKVEHGFSGGPLLNAKEEIVGMNIAYLLLNGKPAESVATPINDIKTVLPRLKSGERIED